MNYLLEQTDFLREMLGWAEGWGLGLGVLKWEGKGGMCLLLMSRD